MEKMSPEGFEPPTSLDLELVSSFSAGDFCISKKGHPKHRLCSICEANQALYPS